EELGPPERHHRADDYEERDEHVPGGVAEIALEVPPKHGPDHVRPERPRLRRPGRRHDRSLAGRFGFERGHRFNSCKSCQLPVVSYQCSVAGRPWSNSSLARSWRHARASRSRRLLSLATDHWQLATAQTGCAVNL